MKALKITIIILSFFCNQTILSQTKIEGIGIFKIEKTNIKVILNHKKEIIDSFSETIKPVIHKEIHHIIREITSFSTKDFENSRGFKEVITDFINWCGDDCVYCTWGSTDLTELQRNMNYHGIPLFKSPVFYYDIQKIFSIVYEDRKTRRSLIYAIEFLDIIKIFL